MAIFVATLLTDGQLYPDYSLASFLQGLKDYGAVYVGSGLGSAYGTSLHAGLLTLFPYRPWVFVTPLIVGAFLACATIIAAWRDRIGIAQLLFLLIATYALASQVFADYHLLAFLLPMVAVMRIPGTLRRDETAMFAALLFVLVPKNYIFLPNDASFAPSLQVLLNPLALLGSAVFVLVIAFRDVRSTAASTSVPTRIA